MSEINIIKPCRICGTMFNIFEIGDGEICSECAKRIRDMIYNPTVQPSYTSYDVGDVVLRHNPNTDTEKLYCIIKANSQTGMYRGITADATCDTFQNDEVVKFAGHTKLIAEVLEQLRFTEGI